MCDGSEYEKKYDRCKDSSDDFYVTSSFITKRSYLRFIKGTPREEYNPSWPQPHQCVYPKANVYYTFSEDTNPFERVDSACQSRQSGKVKPHFEPSQEPYITRDPYFEGKARQKFLETKPTCFAIFGKPDLNTSKLATMVADAWNCVLISPVSLIEEEIKLGSEKGQVLLEMLKLGQSLGQEVVMNLIESRLNMRDVQHRGYIVEGLPLLTNNINLDYSEYPKDTIDWTKHQSVLQSYSKIFGTINDVCCTKELNDTEKDNSSNVDSSTEQISISNELIHQNESCRVNANHEHNIANQINDIFTAWPLKPTIIIYAVCPRNDAIKKRKYMRMNSTTGETVDTSLVGINTNIETEHTHDKLESDTNRPVDYYQEFVKEQRTLIDDPEVFLLRRILDSKTNVEAQYDFYERTAKPVIEKWILLHNPQNVIRVDGRTSILRMFQIISARLRILPIPRLILPRLMDDTEIELGGESPVITTPVDEFEGKTNEEMFHDELMNKNTVSHMFPWRLSSWRFLCPVELIKGRTVEGTWKHAVRFMESIYFLSSSEAADLFIHNPRTFLLPFVPRPTCKIAVFGPRYSGKSDLCKRLARYFRGTVINVREIEKSLAEYRLELDIDVPMTVDEKANAIIENINNIAQEEIDVGIWRDGGYVVDGMYTDIDVWKAVVENSRIVFEDAVYLFDEAPYEYLMNKWRDANRTEKDFYESTEEEAEWLGDTTDNEEAEEEEMEALADYLSHIQQFELDWEVLKESVGEVTKSLINCNLREVNNVPVYVTENIKQRYFDKARIMSDEQKEKERELIEYTEPTEDGENIEAINQDNRRLGDTNYYCPVALSKNNIFWQGKEEFSALFLNKIYHLSSAKALEEFVLNPRKYSVPFLKPRGIIPPLRISILGPMGSGASTLSAAISREYGLMHVDYFQELTNFMKNRAMFPFSPGDSFVSPENLTDDVELPEDLDDERYNSHAATVQTFIRRYWRDGGVLTRKMMRECLLKFFELPYKRYGSILDGYPSCSQDVETAIANYTVPEVMIEIRCDKDEAFKRKVPDLLALWKRRQEEKKEAEYLRYNEAVRDWDERYENHMEWINKMLRERRRQMKYGESAEEDNEIVEDLITDTSSVGTFLQDYSDDDEEYNFEREELEEIWRQENPVPVLFTDWEDFETAKERIERGFEEMYENDSRKLDEIRTAMENESIPWHQINAEKDKRVLLLEIMRILDPYVFRDISVLERTYAVDPETAESLLDYGYYLQTSFGRFCPVQLYKNKIPVHMFLPLEARGEIYPVIHRGYIYFLGGKEAFLEFSKNPLKYLEQDSCSPLVPLRISIIGPPKCGKTTLAERFSREYGMKIITRGKALRTLTKYFPWTETSRLVETDARRGHIASVKSIARAVEMYSIDPSASSQGLLLDGFPENRREYEELVFLGLQPILVIDLKANLDFCLECLSRDNDLTRMPLNFSPKFLARRYANWEVDQESFRDWSKKFSQNVIEVDGTGSTWYVWTRANEAVCTTFRKIKRYFRESDYAKVHRLEHMCVSPYEFRKRQSQCESYCPLCLIEESGMKTSGPPPNHQGMVQFREHFYWFCSEHINRFINDPLKHISLINSMVLPENRPRVLPEIVDKEHSCWANRLRVAGFCLVTYVENLPSRKLVPGKSNLGVIHDDNVYLFCSVECRQQFLERYDKYTSVDIKFPRVLPEIDIKNLPTLGFLEQTVAKLITEVVSEVSVLRPKLPGLSSSATAAIYIGVFLKVRNVSCNLRETSIYETVKERMVAFDEIINVATRTIKRKLNPFVTAPERRSKKVERISDISQLSGRNFIKFRRTSPTQTLTDPEDMPDYSELVFFLNAARRVPVPDARFDYLCDYFKPLSKVPAFLNVVDIAGLVKGAAEGQGLGNSFLSHINACDGIFHLCRAFDDDDVTHIEGDVNPVRDLEIISEELRLKDIEFLNGHLEKLEKLVVRGNDKKLKPEYDTLLKVKGVMVDEKRHIRFADWSANDIEVLNKYLFLTSKPVIYLVNLSEKDYIRKKNKWLIKIKEWVDKNDPGAILIPFSGYFENKVFDMDEAERTKYYEEQKVTSALDKIIIQGYKALQLQYFFTAGHDEVKAWTIQKGTKAPQAAGKIHTDFEKGFIMAEVMKFDDFKNEGSEAAVKGAGKYRQQGRNYVVEDGDIIFFKFNAGAGLKDAKKK